MLERKLNMGKPEKLRHKALIDAAFSMGKTIYDYPLRATYRILSPQEMSDSFRLDVPQAIGALQMLITVPKKKLRHAVDRVTMRRRIREAYRLNRLPLRDAIEQNPEARSISIAFIYLHDDLTSYANIERKMSNILSKIAAKVDRQLPPPAHPGDDTVQNIDN